MSECGLQFAAPVAADGEQREAVVVLEPVLPDLGQEGVDVAGPFRHQFLDVGPCPEAPRMFGVGLGRCGGAGPRVSGSEPLRMDAAGGLARSRAVAGAANKESPPPPAASAPRPRPR